MFRKTVVGSFLYAKSYKEALFRATILPITIALVLEFAFSYINSQPLHYLNNVFLTVLNAIVAINIHNIVLHGVGSVPKWGRFKFGKVELWFIGHYICLAAAFIAITFMARFLGLALILIVVAFGVVACRLSLVFPAIAIGKGVSFPYAWHLSSGKTLYMFSVVAIFPIVLGLVLVPLQTAGVPQVVTSILSYLVTIITVTSLSLAYKLLTEGELSQKN
ncbi:MAG: hypothetical protein V7735_21150 [Photobacterium frigidiphilum]|uniref:hypothetical protein n=1 Tax=Photobacterium frigidiphilum TaxID=264736 RepID=UPI0030013852